MEDEYYYSRWRNSLYVEVNGIRDLWKITRCESILEWDWDYLAYLCLDKTDGLYQSLSSCFHFLEVEERAGFFSVMAMKFV